MGHGKRLGCINPYLHSGNGFLSFSNVVYIKPVPALENNAEHRQISNDGRAIRRRARSDISSEISAVSTN
jgi:hypothetical protein